MTARLLLALLLMFALPTLLPAQSVDPKLTITSLDEVDEDFALQGEYWGSLTRAHHGTRSYGLQVVAQGEGKFQAMVYRGGLPGGGWDRQHKAALEGRRDGQVLQLQGDEFQAVVSPDSAVLQDSGGQSLGGLDKIHRIGPSQGAAAPREATVLFNGQGVDQLDKGETTEDNLLKPGFTTRAEVQDFRLHVEFRTPYMPNARGQQRGNSGVYIQRRYEVQILDSFGLEGKPNECAGLYRQQSPDINMCLPPLSWQTYDIYFTAARWDSQGKKSANARITVLHNGVAVHDHRDIVAKTGAGQKEGPEPRPIHFQNHSNPVYFRNLWLINHQVAAPRADAPASSFSPAPGIVNAPCSREWLQNPLCPTRSTRPCPPCRTRRSCR